MVLLNISEKRSDWDAFLIYIYNMCIPILFFNLRYILGGVYILKGCILKKFSRKILDIYKWHI